MRFLRRLEEILFLAFDDLYLPFDDVARIEHVDAIVHSPLQVALLDSLDQSAYLDLELARGCSALVVYSIDVVEDFSSRSEVLATEDETLDIVADHLQN